MIPLLIKLILRHGFHRKGRITASLFYDVIRYMKKGRGQYPLSIVKRIMQYYDVLSMKYGREHENDARQQYISLQENNHENMEVTPCGLVVDPPYPFLGASPDGRVSCACCGNGVIEIKCPYKYRDHLPTDDIAILDKDFCLTRCGEGNEVHLRKDHRYYLQIQGQIACPVL